MKRYRGQHDQRKVALEVAAQSRPRNVSTFRKPSSLEEWRWTAKRVGGREPGSEFLHRLDGGK